MDRQKLAEKLAEPFQKMNMDRRNTLDSIEAQLQEDREQMPNWKSWHQKMRGQVAENFRSWTRELEKTARPIKASYFFRARRNLWFYRTGTWLHWRGIIYRLQISGMWLVRISLLALVPALIYLLIRGLFP